MTGTDKDPPFVNRLASSASPYLRAHAGQPIAWQPWDEAARALARRLDRPILLSAGYAACHWCHVMARESFSDPRIAELVNEHFVPIKLDREEHPQIDHFHQLALAHLGVAGGWPLTMFLLPDGRPFAGGTYFPPHARDGMPGFAAVLSRIADVWENARERAREAARRLVRAIERHRVRPPVPATRSADADDRIVEAVRRLLAEADREHGGLGHAPKFPQIPVLRLLWRMRRLPGVGETAAAVVPQTCRAMVAGGIHDHLGGGFCRYAVDRAWRVPHFEKMLFDNAEILSLLAEIARMRPEPWIVRTAERLVDWLMREMRVDDIGFAAALDADSEGGEGRFHLWEIDELKEVLGEEFSFFARFHELPPAGHLDGRIVLNRLPMPAWRTSAEDEKRLSRLHARLFRRRERRPRPMRDDKIVAAWNGLTVAALVDAGRILGRGDWISCAAQVFDALLEHLRDEKGRLHRHLFADRRGPSAGLEDHAALARAALALHLANGDDRLIATAAGLAEDAHRLFHDSDSGLYRLGERAGLPFAPLAVTDGPTPSGAALLLEVFDTLALLDDEGRWSARAARLAEALSAFVATHHPAAVAGALCALERHRRIRHLALVGLDPSENPAMRALRDAALKHLPVGAVLSRHPGGRAHAVWCVGATCGPPMRTADELIRTLREET